MAERLTEKDSIENKRYVLNSEDNQIILTSAKLKNGFRKTYYYGKPIEKLAQFEDIMEKYGIESVEELSNALEFAKVIEKTLSEYGIKDNEELEDKIIYYEENKDANLGLKLDIKKLEQELATWKRACELARETLKQVMGKPLWIGGNIPTPEVKDSDYFYQQAKKEKQL